MEGSHRLRACGDSRRGRRDVSARSAVREPHAPARRRECRSASFGISAPLTGPAAFIGQEQLSWVQFAAQQYNRQFGSNYKIVQGDTQLSASLARTVGRRLVSNRAIMGVVGPSTSQAVISSAGLFKVAGLAAVSGSATRTDLTNGRFTDLPPSRPERRGPVAEHRELRVHDPEGAERGRRRLAGRLLDCPRKGSDLPLPAQGRDGRA